MTSSRVRAWIGAIAFAMLVLCVASPRIAVAEPPPLLPPAGDDPAALDPSLVEGARRHGDDWAVPLRGARPSWLTPRLLRRVHAAGGRPVPVPDHLPTAATIERGIRPGSLMVAPYGCTMNFVFRRPGGFAIGTAGHCVDRLDQRVVLEVLAPGNEGVVLVSIGRVVKLALNERGLAPDFALVRVRERLEDWVAPTITSIGGPCGIFRGSGIQTLWHYGYPLALAGAERTGLSIIWRDVGYAWAGAALFGDSGSPVRTGGYGAAGNLGGIILASPGWVPGALYGTRMTWIEGFVAPWRLVSSPGCG